MQPTYQPNQRHRFSSPPNQRREPLSSPNEPQVFQPLESHIPFLLHFLVDNNLYGERTLASPPSPAFPPLSSKDQTGSKKKMANEQNTCLNGTQTNTKVWTSSTLRPLLSGGRCPPPPGTSPPYSLRGRAATTRGAGVRAGEVGTLGRAVDPPTQRPPPQRGSHPLPNSRYSGSPPLPLSPRPSSLHLEYLVWPSLPAVSCS